MSAVKHAEEVALEAVARKVKKRYGWTIDTGEVKIVGESSTHDVSVDFHHLDLSLKGTVRFVGKNRMPVVCLHVNGHLQGQVPELAMVASK